MSVNSADATSTALLQIASHDGTGHRGRPSWDELLDSTSHLYERLTKRDFYEAAVLLAAKLHSANTNIDADAALAMQRITRITSEWQKRTP